MSESGACLPLLQLRHRHEDLNMHSVWLCSRNDVINSIAVIGAGVLVGLLHSHWPDLIVGALIAGLFLHACYGVISRAGLDVGQFSASVRPGAAAARPSRRTVRSTPSGNRPRLRFTCGASRDASPASARTGSLVNGVVRCYLI